jgi:hypothetical protein
MIRNNTEIFDKDAQGNVVKVDTANMLDTYRWDSRIDKWVPAGLHHDGSNWEKFNLKTVFANIPATDLFSKYS